MIQMINLFYLEKILNILQGFSQLTQSNSKWNNKKCILESRGTAVRDFTNWNLFDKVDEAFEPHHSTQLVNFPLGQRF